MTKPMLTKNTDKLRQEVAAHVAADSIVQGTYWDAVSKSGCFIGCLAHEDNPAFNETAYGLPVMVQRIAENIFEALPADEAKKFFAALPSAVNCDGKNLTNVGWQFLAAELRSLPKQPAKIQAVIDPVITGMDLLASGQEWAAAAAAAVADTAADADVAVAARAARAAVAAAAVAAAAAAYGAAADARVAAADAAAVVAVVAARAARAAAAVAAVAAAAAAARDARDARVAAADAAYGAAAYARAAAADAAAAVRDARAAAAAAAPDARADARLPQRDLLLRLISEAPVVEALDD